MTCTKKKISVEVAVPDGATHYKIIEYAGQYRVIDWLKFCDGSWYFFQHDYWCPYCDQQSHGRKPIEVIE